MDIWGSHASKKGISTEIGGTTRCKNKINSVQRAGALAITRGLRTSPSNTLNVHAYLLPLQLEIEKHLYRAATRIATLPPQHPLYKPARKAANLRTKRHKSPLHDLMQTFKIKLNNYETIPAVGRNPAKAYKRPFTMSIAANKEASKKEDATGDKEIKVYSDGSAQDGKVGAAAVLVRLGQATRMLHFHLGVVEHHTVFEAELVGLMLGLHLIKTKKSGRTSYALGADNLAAISALATPSNRSGHFLVDLCLTVVTSIHKSRGTANYKLKVRWMAGHVSIEGNELVDKEAKAAMEGKTSPTSSLPKVLRKPL